LSELAFDLTATVLGFALLIGYPTPCRLGPQSNG